MQHHSFFRTLPPHLLGRKGLNAQSHFIMETNISSTGVQFLMQGQDKKYWWQWKIDKLLSEVQIGKKHWQYHSVTHVISFGTTVQ